MPKSNKSTQNVASENIFQALQKTVIPKEKIDVEPNSAEKNDAVHQKIKPPRKTWAQIVPGSRQRMADVSASEF